MAAAGGGAELDEPVEITLPVGWFQVAPGAAKCLAIPVSEGYGPFPGRKFGPFLEKTLTCNRPARQAIDQMCYEGGFTQAWSPHQSVRDGEEFWTMTKIPAIILVKLMLGLPADQEAQARTVRGAYAICMDPDVRTCMNVVVGRRSNASGGFVLDKFSLYYPNNADIPDEWRESSTWDLLLGYSFRTAALSGSLNRAGLQGIALNFPCKDYGLVIDDASAYEDCAYVRSIPDETAAKRTARISSMVDAMVAIFGGSGGCLAQSYDPAEQERGLTALQGEWELLQAQIEDYKA